MHNIALFRVVVLLDPHHELRQSVQVLADVEVQERLKPGVPDPKVAQHHQDVFAERLD